MACQRNVYLHSNTMSVESAATTLGVSSATVRNWAKAGHLPSLAKRPLSFAQEDVLRLKASLKSGDIARLRTRANKSTSVSTSIPTEYICDPATHDLLNTLLGLVPSPNSYDEISTILFALAMRLLELRGEVSFPFHGSLQFEEFHSWRRLSMREEMKSWYSTLNNRNSLKGYYEAFRSSIACTTNDDILGLVYQASTIEGERSTRGSYYTPLETVNKALSHIGVASSSFLDPCCGTGQYLLCAARLCGLSLDRLFGYDIDDLATRIARVNLLLEFPNEDSRPQIECLDAIRELATGDVFCTTNHFIGKIGSIATNPPWGAYKNILIPAHLSSVIRSHETFSLFIAKSISLLKPGGRLSLVLPESILRIRMHSDVRKLILSETIISCIAHLGRPFPSVFTKVIRLDLIKGNANPDHILEVEDSGKVHCVSQSRFLRNENFCFDEGITLSEDAIFSKLFSAKYRKLKYNADWALGIVTGNNKKYLVEQQTTGMEAIYRGSDIVKFCFLEPRSYVHFEPETFQQVARAEYYRAPEKLVYKFISKRLVFAYDNAQRLTLNSANILIPKFADMPIKVVMAFLNSDLFQYLFQKRFSTHKVLRGDLEELPFPVLSSKECDAVEKVVDRIILGEDLILEMNNLIYKYYNLNDSEILQIQKELLN